jgi:hypothetical protein
MSDPVMLALVSAVANGLVTWGVVSVKLEWLRRDLDRVDGRVTFLERQGHEA